KNLKVETLDIDAHKIYQLTGRHMLFEQLRQRRCHKLTFPDNRPTMIAHRHSVTAKAVQSGFIEFVIGQRLTVVTYRGFDVDIARSFTPKRTHTSRHRVYIYSAPSAYVE